MNITKSKKAQGMNYIAVLFVLIMFGFMSIFVYTVWIEFVSALTTGGFYVGQVKITVDDFTTAFQALDYLIVLLMVGMVIGIGWTSFKLPTRTAFFLVTIIMAAFWGFISFFFNYLFIQMVSPSVLSTAVGVFPRTMILCTNLHWVMMIEIIVGSITLYGKREKGQFLS